MKSRAYRAEKGQRNNYSMLSLTGQWPLHSVVHVLTILAVQHMTSDKTVPNRGIISLPAVHGPNAGEGNVSI